MISRPERASGADADEIKAAQEQARQRLEQLVLPEESDGWVFHDRGSGRQSHFGLPRTDALAHLVARYRFPEVYRSEAEVIVELRGSSRFLGHDMVGYWLTHAEKVEAAERSGQTVCAYETFYGDHGLWWTSGVTSVVVFWQRVQQGPTAVVEALLKQFPSELKKEDIGIDYDEWAKREIDRRLDDLSSDDPDLRALAARHIDRLADRGFDVEGFLAADGAKREKFVQEIRTWWREARPTFKHHRKAVMGFGPFSETRSEKPREKNPQELRLERLRLPEVGGGWILRGCRLEPPSSAPSMANGLSRAYLRAEYRQPSATGDGEMNVAIGVYPASEFLLHDMIGRSLPNAEKWSAQEQNGQLVCLVDIANADNWVLWWTSAEGAHLVFIGLHLEQHVPRFPDELTKALLSEFPSTLKKEDVEITYDEWARREIDRRLEELPSDDPEIRKRAAWIIGPLTGRYVEFKDFHELDDASRQNLIQRFRAWWKDARKDFKARVKMRFD